MVIGDWCWQMSTHGFPETSGLSQSIDYFISVDDVEVDDAARFVRDLHRAARGCGWTWREVCV